MLLCPAGGEFVRLHDLEAGQRESKEDTALDKALDALVVLLTILAVGGVAVGLFLVAEMYLGVVPIDFCIYVEAVLVFQRFKAAQRLA